MEPLRELDAQSRTRVLDELRAILREREPQKADERRQALAESLQPDHPQAAEWILGQNGREDSKPTTPQRAFELDQKKIDKLKGKVVLIKYGGNAMVDETAKQRVIRDICTFKQVGAKPVVVHGGGPVISELLKRVGVKSHFIGGHRKTDPSVMAYVEMALSGKVNSEIVKLISFNGFRSVGISGKDGNLVTATKRIHEVREASMVRKSDLGQVGDVASIDTTLVDAMLDADFIPVIAPIGVGEDLQDYNINADMFAGHMAAALDAVAYVAMTDVDGIYLDKDDPDTLIPEFSAHAARAELGRIVQGGMIPKIESCLIALDGGVEAAHIVSGMVEHAMLDTLLGNEQHGTCITANS